MKTLFYVLIAVDRLAVMKIKFIFTKNYQV